MHRGTFHHILWNRSCGWANYFHDWKRTGNAAWRVGRYAYVWACVCVLTPFGKHWSRYASSWHYFCAKKIISEEMSQFSAQSSAFASGLTCWGLHLTAETLTSWIPVLPFPNWRPLLLWAGGKLPFLRMACFCYSSSMRYPLFIIWTLGMLGQSGASSWLNTS